MSLRIFEQYRTGGVSFNMTPVIDIVFLLIVFFVVVFQFIGTEGSPVELPRDSGFAEKANEDRHRPVTLTVRRDGQGRIFFEVGTETIKTSSKDLLINNITESLNSRLKGPGQSERVVVLRVDKNIVYGDAQYALAAAGQSLATGLRLATISETKRGGDEAGMSDF